MNTTTRSVFTKFQGNGAPENGDNLCFDTNRYGIGTTYYDVDNDDLFLRIDRQGDATDFIAIIDGSTPETLTVTENGTYTPEDGKSFNKAVVNVPQPSWIHTIKVKRTEDSEWEEIEFNMFPPFPDFSQYYAVDLNGFDASKMYKAVQMFYDCSFLTTLNLGGNFDTSNVTNMNSMLEGCSSLTTLNLGEKFDTSNVTDMGSMFDGCNDLIDLNLGNKFDTSNVTNMGAMFNACTSLTTLDLGNEFNTSNVTDMYSMFSACSSLTTLDLGNKFDTSNVTSMSSMFEECSSLTTLNLGNKFDTSNVTDMDDMFYGCSSLTEITVGLIGTLGSGSNVDKLIGELSGTWTYDESTGKITKQ